MIITWREGGWICDRSLLILLKLLLLRGELSASVYHHDTCERTRTKDQRSNFDAVRSGIGLHEHEPWRLYRLFQRATIGGQLAEAKAFWLPFLHVGYVFLLSSAWVCILISGLWNASFLSLSRLDLVSRSTSHFVSLISLIYFYICIFFSSLMQRASIFQDWGKNQVLLVSHHNMSHFILFCLCFIVLFAFFKTCI